MANTTQKVVATSSTTASTGTTHEQALTVLKRGDFELAGTQRHSILLDASEKNLISNMETITSEELDKFVASIEEIQTKDVAALLSGLFDFQGFDPIQVIKRLLSINKYYQAKDTTPPETQETLKQDIMMMVAANIIMGNLQLRSIGRRSDRGRAALEYLVSKYKMRLGSTGAGLPSDHLTFPRVANSFPVLTCRSAMALPSKSLSKSPFGAKDIPRFMRVSAFASLCGEGMEERTRLFLLRVVCAYSCDQMITVHEGEKRKRKVRAGDDVFLPEDAWALQWNYIEVSSNSPVPSDKMRRAMMVEFQVGERFPILNPVYLKTIDILKDKVPTLSEDTFKADIAAYASGTVVPAIAPPPSTQVMPPPS